ncbi:MAG: stage 0 sporulation protein [Bacilli bacterium]|nr:stage 0 sporulation protein [Bacilli bacterium]
MNKRPGALGKGLEALLPQLSDDDQVSSVSLTMMRANPYQPRREFNEEQLQELAQSIQEHGVIQPLIVRGSIHGYEIVAGERRFRAAKMAGLSEVPVVVRDYTDQQMTEIALIENIQRADLNPLEVAEGYQALMEKFGLTQEDLSHRVGQSRSHVANFLRLLQLPHEVREHVSRGTLSMGHARALVGLKDAAQQKLLAKKIIDEELSVRQVEHMLYKMSQNVPRETKKTLVKPTFIKQYEERFRYELGTSVKIHAGKKRGTIEIEYFSSEDLERILTLVSNKHAQ